MHRWYSPRGARRGLLIAATTAALWFAWAVGYSQGVVHGPQPSVSPARTTTQSDPACPLHPAARPVEV